MANIAQEIALLERQKKSAKSNRDKVDIMRKVKDLKEELTKQQQQTALPTARKAIKQMPNESFKELIARLKLKPEYAFLKNMGLGKIADDYRVIGKPVGWRLKGYHNYKVPSKKFRKDNPDLVYYEDRKNRSDVHRPDRLKQGGEVGDNNSIIFDSLKKGDKINITFSSGISKTNEKKLQVRSKNIVGKGKSYESEKITFDNLDNPTGVKYYAYKRKDDSVGFAMGDMAISNVVINKSGMMAKGGGVGKAKSYLHLYKLTSPNGQYRVEVYDGAAMTPKEALEKMRISLRGLKSYKYAGASSDSDNYKKWHTKKDIGYSDTEAWDEVFGKDKYAEGGMFKKPIAAIMDDYGNIKSEKILQQDLKYLKEAFEDKMLTKNEYIKDYNQIKEQIKLLQTKEKGGMMAKGGGVLANAKKKVAKMTDDEVVQEISTIYHYDMQDNDFEMEELYNDIDIARKELIKHYAEEGEDITTGYFANGGQIDNYKHFDLNSEGNFASKINGKNYEIIYRDDKSQLYDLFENGKKIKSSNSVRNVMTFEDGGEVKTGVEIMAAPKGHPDVEGNFLFPANANKNTLGIKLAKGGNLKYYDKDTEYRLGRPSGSIEKEILEKVKYYTSSDELFMGNFGWITPNKKRAKGYLYKLDGFDTILKDVKLKAGERIFIYLNSTTAIGGMTPLIKINLDKELLYFLADSDNDEIVFETKGVPAQYIALIEHKMAKGGVVVTSIKDIPNFQERLDEGKITYRGLGLGKLWDDFYKVAGTSGTRIKVDKKEYFITDKEFDKFSRSADGKMRIRFDAPFRK